MLQRMLSPWGPTSLEHDADDDRQGDGEAGEEEDHSWTADASEFIQHTGRDKREENMEDEYLKIYNQDSTASSLSSSSQTTTTTTTTSTTTSTAASNADSDAKTGRPRNLPSQQTRPPRPRKPPPPPKRGVRITTRAVAAGSTNEEGSCSPPSLLMPGEKLIYMLEHCWCERMAPFSINAVPHHLGSTTAMAAALSKSVSSNVRNGGVVREHGTLLVTNYRILFLIEDSNATSMTASDLSNASITTTATTMMMMTISVPLASILDLEESITMSSNNAYNPNNASPNSITFICKSMFRFRIILPNSSISSGGGGGGSNNNVGTDIDSYHIIRSCVFPNPRQKTFFAFENKEHFDSDLNGWTLYDPVLEFSRQGAINTQNSPWRMTSINQEFKLIPTYPPYFVVPSTISDEELRHCVGYRSKERIPVLTWVHPINGASITRCSQPMVGLTRSRSREDERLVRAIRLASSPPGSNSTLERTLFVVDVRPKSNALANTAMGKGYEIISNYDRCHLSFIGIENIHAMRESLNALSRLCQQIDEDGRIGGSNDSRYLSNLEATGWLEHIRLLLSGAHYLVQRVHEKGSSVLVHCSDGWDRTSQLCALAQLLMDPFYRTIHGFAVLIEKDFLSFGHRFDDRCCPLKKPDDQFSPIFLQFIDCVWQLTQQFPKSFEFNEAFLIHLMDAVHSCRFGTFLFNSAKEREDHNVKQRTISAWTCVNARLSEFTNRLYCWRGATNAEVLIPATTSKQMQLWEAYYLRYNGGSRSHFGVDLLEAFNELDTTNQSMEEQIQKQEKHQIELQKEVDRLRSENNELKRIFTRNGCTVFDDEEEGSDGFVQLKHLNLIEEAQEQHDFFHEIAAECAPKEEACPRTEEVETSQTSEEPPSDQQQLCADAHVITDYF